MPIIDDEEQRRLEKLEEEEALYGCNNLKSITIPESVKEIRISFRGCNNLQIVSPKGSYAAEYARKNNIEYLEG